MIFKLTQKELREIHYLVDKLVYVWVKKNAAGIESQISSRQLSNLCAVITSSGKGDSPEIQTGRIKGYLEHQIDKDTKNEQEKALYRKLADVIKGNFIENEFINPSAVLAAYINSDESKSNIKQRKSYIKYILLKEYIYNLVGELKIKRSR